MSKHSPLRKPWYRKAQDYVNEYRQGARGWFSFTESPIELEMIALLGAKGEKAKSVREEIERFDQRFFLSRWLRLASTSTETEKLYRLFVL